MRDEFWDTAPHYGGQKGELKVVNLGEELVLFFFQKLWGTSYVSQITPSNSDVAVQKFGMPFELLQKLTLLWRS